MDVSADRSTRTSVPRRQPAPAETLRSPRRRRPTGEPPPLPHHLQTSGVRWLVAAVVLVGADDRGLRRRAARPGRGRDGRRRRGGPVAWPGCRRRGWSAIWRGAGRPQLLVGPQRRCCAGLLLALLVLRRFRHLIVLAGPGAAAGAWSSRPWLAAIAQRPRPFGVEHPGRAGAAGRCRRCRSRCLAAMLVGDPVHAGAGGPLAQHRQVGGGRAGGAGRRSAASRLGADAPTDVLVGVAIGVTIPLVAFRRFAPNEVFPITYRRGRSAHLDVGGARGAGDPAGAGGPARPGRRGGQAVRAGRVGRLHPAADHGQGRPATASCSASCTPRATCAPTAGTSWAGSCCTAGWRTRSRSTPCGGWSSRRTTRCR